jgi:colanic acid biosynthesis glycosyl transferase WcaI
MNILYVSQYFPPEGCAPAARVHDLACQWGSSGHSVRVLTGFPNHPDGVLHPAYRRKWLRGFARERNGSMEVYRTWLFPAPNRGLWGRSANYVSFGLSASVVGPMIVPNGGIVIGTSPQLLVGAAGLFISASRKVPFVFEVRDLWPESLVAVGQTTPDSFLYSFLRRLAHLLYTRADHIVVDGKWKRAALIDLGIPPAKIDVIPNGVSDEFCLEPEAETTRQIRREIRCENNWTDRFVVMYSGTVGMAHGLETILLAADRLRNHREIIFVIVGDGAERKNFIDRIRDLQLPNVVYLGKQPRERIPAFLASADACLVPLKRSPAFRTAIPSKMFEGMGAGKPVLLAVEGEAEELLTEARAGIALRPESAEDMAAAVVKLWQLPELCRELGTNGRRAVMSNFSRNKQAATYIDILANVMHFHKGKKMRPRYATAD